MENFLKVLTEDATVSEDFLRQTTPEGAYLVAKPYLDGMPMEEFIESLLGIARVMDKAQSGEFSDVELSTVSGGVQGDFTKAMAAFKENL